VITRNVWRKRRDAVAEDIQRRAEERGELILVSWIFPNPQRHPRHWRRMQAQMRFDWIFSSEGWLVN
jgi:hypothetical protein